MKPVVFHEAFAEFDHAAATYEHHRRGLGAEFRIAVENAIRRIEANPLAGTRFGTTRFRFVIARRFPYVVYFAETDAAIQIIAIAHGRRRPGYWRRRRF